MALSFRPIMNGLYIKLAGIILLSCLSFFPQSLLAKQDSQDIASVISKEGNKNSQVMILAHELVNEIGPRLSNSPQAREAEDWIVQKFKEWGFKKVRKEGFEFGSGWSIVSSDVNMVSPRSIALNTIPIAWSAPTQDTLKASVIVAPINGKADFERWHGKLRGKIVMIDPPGLGDEASDPVFERFSDQDLQRFNHFWGLPYLAGRNDRIISLLRDRSRLEDFLVSEGALAFIRKSPSDGQLLHGDGFGYGARLKLKLPAIEMSAEDYRRTAALSKAGDDTVLEITNDVRFHDKDAKAYNIIAQIKGSDPKSGYVMVGAHYDSWHVGDGASDNGAGVVMVMEAARILWQSGIKPKRTIKFALWAAEEQGLIGSRAYAEKHLVTRKSAHKIDNHLIDFFDWAGRFPLEKRKGYDDMNAYFNIDNGSGLIRGIYANGEQDTLPILNSWLSQYAGNNPPRAYLSAPSGISDEAIMQSLGLPSYKFIQDPLDYNSRTHHTNADTFDHLREDDIRKSSTIIAGVMLAAANSEEEIPVRAFPTTPKNESVR